MRTLIRPAIVMIALASCAGSGAASADPEAGPTDHVVASIRPSTTDPAPTPTPPPTPDPARRIDVGSLPGEGVAVDLGGEVRLLDLDGRVLARLRGYRLYYDWTVPGPVVLRRHDTYFVLRVDRGVARPLASRDAAFDLSPQFEAGLALARPRGWSGGRWAYALPGPGELTLAQWSGECEVPAAMFLRPGETPVSPTGVTFRSAPESKALGWDDRGRALVHLMHGVCGTSFDRPGIYAFTGPGVGEPLYRDRRVVGARMWGPAA